MIPYEPKQWWRGLFDFQRSPVFRTLILDVFIAGAWAALVVWVETDVFKFAVPLGPAFLSILGIFINLLFLTFTIRPQWSSSLSLNERLLLAVAAEHVLIAAKIALDKLIPDVPAAMRKRTARLQYMATRAAQHGSVSSAASSASLLARMNGVVAAPIQ